MSFNYRALRIEIDDDPLGRGYAAMSNAEVADDLNTEYRNISVDTIPSEDIVAALVPSEVNALTVIQQRNLWGVIGAGSVKPDDADVKAFFAGLFGAGTTTRANLLALATQIVSRGAELGLGTVYAPYVLEARAM